MPVTGLSRAVLPVLDAAPRLGVHSVFDSAINLRAGHRLVTCTAPGAGAPHGVELSEDDLHRLRDRLRAHPDATLFFNTARRRFTGALTVPPSPDCTEFDPQLPVVGTAGWAGLEPLTDHLLRRRPPTGFGSDWPALLADHRLADLVASLASGRVDAAVTYWLGRGPGLTPSGDDVVVGVLAALWSTGRASAGSSSGSSPGSSPESSPGSSLGSWPGLVTALTDAVTGAGAATNVISAEYLRYACAGMVAGPPRRLLTALHGGDPAAVVTAAERATRYGHTSGVDLTLGILVGLRELTGTLGPSDP